MSRVVRRVEGVTFHDLYETYPDFDVDVKREQALLESHDLYVLQHPMYWYSVPPLVKQWLDLVLEHGWAYGKNGTALRGKRMFHALSTGGSEGTYCATGQNCNTIRQFFLPLEQTARLCGIDWLPPFVVHGTHALGPEEIASRAEEYARVVEAFRDGRLDLDAVRLLGRINDLFDAARAP